jgi:hypothetical protein
MYDILICICALRCHFKLISEILNDLIDKTMAGNIFCHLEKAFGCVNHDLLQESYLHNRYKGVQIINFYLNPATVSKWTKIKCGLSQGSILFPLLFLVYINEDFSGCKRRLLES